MTSQRLLLWVWVHSHSGGGFETLPGYGRLQSRVRPKACRCINLSHWPLESFSQNKTCSSGLIPVVGRGGLRSWQSRNVAQIDERMYWKVCHKRSLSPFRNQGATSSFLNLPEQIFHSKQFQNTSDEFWPGAKQIKSDLVHQKRLICDTAVKKMRCYNHIWIS